MSSIRKEKWAYGVCDGDGVCDGYGVRDGVRAAAIPRETET
jgi:hypothetical protein